MTVTPVDLSIGSVLFDGVVSAGSRVQLGLIRLLKGQRVPDTGVSSHDRTEYAYVIQGRLRVGNGESMQIAAAGDLIHTPATDVHFAEVIEESLVIYLLV